MTPSPDAMAEAERLLPCENSDCANHRRGPEFSHSYPQCPASHKHAVASALQRLMDENKGLRDALETADKAMNRALTTLKAQGESVRPGNVLGALDAAIANTRTALSSKEPQS